MTRRTSPTIRLSQPVSRRRYPSGKPKELPPQRGPEPKTVYLRRDREGWWVITCSYHRRFLTAFQREVPNRQWCPETKTWRVANDSFPLLKEVLDEFFEKIIIVRPRGAAPPSRVVSKVQYVEADARTKAPEAFARTIDEDDEEEGVDLGDLPGLEGKIKVQSEE
jgi:hypothetical protein